MKRLIGSVVCGLVCVAGCFAQEQSPFEVTPSLEQCDGCKVLRIAFFVPTNHLLYAEKLSFKLGADGDPISFQLPEPVVIQDKFSKKEKKVFTQSFVATHRLEVATEDHLALTVHLQGCDEANCYFPEDRRFSISNEGRVARFDDDAEGNGTGGDLNDNWRSAVAGFAVTGQGSGYMGEGEFLRFLGNARAGTTSSDGFAMGTGFWGVLLTMGLIVLGGAALNLTPCILPMIPINLAIIGAGAQAGSKRRGFALGATYAAGMAFAYGLLGLVVVLTGSKFGTLNSSPWFNLGIASVFLFLALAMFDVVNVDLSRFQRGGGDRTSKSKFVVAYTMGTVAALLAGACVAPVVISVLLQATSLYAKGITIGLLLPFLLGLGMGLPWPFAGAGLSFLPKPGRWMVRVKYGFGVLIILFAMYYGHLASGLFRSGATLLAQARTMDSQIENLDSSLAELNKAVAAAKVDGRPVLVDFYASWCKNCSAMEHTTFASEQVKLQLTDFHVVRFQAERPNESPAKDVLDHFKVLGLPSFVVLQPEAGGSLAAGSGAAQNQ